MDYVLGSLVTVAVLFVANYFYQSKKLDSLKINLRFSQSQIFEIVRPTMQQILQSKPFKTQATNHYDQNRVKVIITDKKAYWIRDNAVYEADVVNGIVQENSTKTVDMMALDEVKLKDMMFIVDRLTEGQTDDSRDSWN